MTQFWHHVDLFFNNGIYCRIQTLIESVRQQRLWCYTLV